MLDHEDRLDPAADLAEAREKLEAVREAPQPLLDGPEGGAPEIRQAVARLGRMAVEVARIERTVAVRAPATA